MGKSLYSIQFGGLPVGIHEYEFRVDEQFFNGIENSEVSTADIIISAKLTKQNNLLNLAFNLDGTVRVGCDRCLKEFDFPVDASASLVVKHGRPEESTDEIIVIPHGQEYVDLKQYLYETIVLAIPGRRVPCEIDEEAYRCDEEVLSKLNDLTVDQNENEKNPLWEKLNKIKFNKN